MFSVCVCVCVFLCLCTGSGLARELERTGKDERFSLACPAISDFDQRNPHIRIMKQMHRPTSDLGRYLRTLILFTELSPSSESDDRLTG
jgi:hypothetical protein